MAKTKLENGIRVNLDTGMPVPASTERQGQALSKLTPSVISSAELTPEKDFTIPTAPPLSLGAGLQGQIKAQADQQGLEQSRQEAEKKKITSFDDLASALSGQRGEIERTDSEYTAGGVDTAKAEVTEINQQILAEEEALRRQVERIQTAPGTATAGERDREVQEATRNSIRKQADLSVVQLAKQGRYADAKAVADRAVAVQLEKQRQEIDLKQRVFDENKDMFTLSEQREFETKQKTREREFAMEDFRLKSDYEQKIRQNDPAYKLDLQLKGLQIAETAFKLDQLKNPPVNSGLSSEALERIQKLNATSQEKLVNATDTVDQLTRLKQMIAENDAVTLSNPFDENGRAFQRLATDVADKMARERTGAVVTKEEQGNFKTILGLSLFNRTLAPSEEVNRELDKFINKHTNTQKLIDPSGEIRSYLGQTGVDSEEAYVNSVTSTLTDPVTTYIESLPPK